jgi:hypothetical protein
VQSALGLMLSERTCSPDLLATFAVDFMATER